MRILLLGLSLSASAAGAYYISGPQQVRMEPGLWTVSAEVDDLEMSGISSDRTAELKAALLSKLAPREPAVCVTAEHAKAISAAKLTSRDLGGGGDCRFDRKQFVDGKIDVAGVCTDPQGERRFVVTGTVAPDKVDATIALDLKSNQGQSARARLHIGAQRTGPCREGDETALPRTGAAEPRVTRTEAMNGAAAMPQSEPAAVPGSTAPMTDLSRYR